MGDDRLTVEVKQLPSSRAAPRWRLKSANIDFTVDRAARVGAAKGNDLVLDAPTVSRVHAEVLAEPEGVRVRDLGSTNGTRVNGVSISEAVAEPGMKVQFGELALMVERTSQVEEPLAAAARFGRLVGHSAAMRSLFHQLEKLAPSSSTVLLQAESGSGKELVARALHDASPRAGGPWVVLDCAGVAPTLLESALFGHEKGAFTGAVARKAGVSKRRTAARCSSMRLPSSRSSSSRGCCARSRAVRCGASEVRSPFPSTCASSPPRTSTSRAR